MGEEEKGKPEILDITQLDTYNLLAIFINILAEKAWQHMGLKTAQGTEKIDEDFESAQTAIDCISYLIDKLEPHIQENGKGKLRSILADLQINFVRLKKDKK